MIQSFSFGVATEPGFLLWSLNDLASVKHVEDFWIPDIFDFEGFEALALGLMLHIRFCFNDYCTQNWLSNWRLYNEYAYIRLFIYICVHQYSVHHLNTVQSHLLTPCFEVTQPQKASEMNYQMCISLLLSSQNDDDHTWSSRKKLWLDTNNVDKDFDSPLGDHWESINPGCEGNTVLVLGNLWIRRIFHVYWYVLCL